MAIDDLVVETNYGPVRGIAEDNVKAWKGIRYAAAPTGELRFRAPQPPARSAEVADATAFGPACPQPRISEHAIGFGRTTGRGLLAAQRLGVF